MLTYYNPCVKIVFPENTFNASSGKRLFYKTPFLRTLLYVRKRALMNAGVNLKGGGGGRMGVWAKHIHLREQYFQRYQVFLHAHFKII